MRTSEDEKRDSRQGVREAPRAEHELSSCLIRPLLYLLQYTIFHSWPFPMTIPFSIGDSTLGTPTKHSECIVQMVTCAFVDSSHAFLVVRSTLACDLVAYRFIDHGVLIVF